MYSNQRVKDFFIISYTHSIAYPQILHAFADFDDGSRSVVAQGVRKVGYVVSDISDVRIESDKRCVVDFDQNFARTRFGRWDLDGVDVSFPVSCDDCGVFLRSCHV